MAEFTTPKHGEICWQELNTKNLEKAKNFYSELFGWQLKQSEFSPVPYLEIHAGEKASGGMMEISKEWGENWEKIPSAWMTYIAVDDVDSAVEKIKANGGSICIAPFDAPGVGRMSVAADPGGIAFSIIKLQT